MIELIPALPRHVLGLVAQGRVTREDFEAVVDPAVANALEQNPRLRILFILGEAFDEMEEGALKEDTFLGMRFTDRIERVAVVTDHDWLTGTISAMAYFLPMDVRAFTTADETAARDWVTS